MTTWSPAPRSHVEDILSRQLGELAPNEREAFEAIRIPIRQVAIADDSGHSVYVVAEYNDRVVYWEDVEEGWNATHLNWAGRIPSRGYEQDDLRALVYRLRLISPGEEK
jgi:hypothetical protein